uniref:Peptidase S8 n=1 Tax=Desulfacinum infernum TaxID=35837 RepID=A0A832A4D0_9BACT
MFPKNRLFKVMPVWQLAFSSAAPRLSLWGLVVLLAVGFCLMGGRGSAWADKPQWASGRILVQARAGIHEAELDAVLGDHGARRLHALERLRVHVVQVPPQAEEAIARALSKHPKIQFAEPDALIPPDDTIPNDPKYSSQWHLPLMKAPGAWDYTVGDGVIVAVLDTGVDGTHPDLSGKLVPGWNMYDNNADTSDVYGHGTNVAGVVGAAANNALGVASLAWNAKIMPVRISQPDGYAYYSTIASGLTWAADHGARIANISYMVTGSSTVTSAANYFRQKGGVVFASAGNTGALENIAENPSIVSVAATTSSDTRASWSSYGNFVDLSAPGSGILTTARGGNYASVSGTSFSSPAAAAVGALLLSVNPTLSPDLVERILEETAVDLGTAGWDIYYGNGRVNAQAAVLAALQTGTVDTQAPTVRITAPAGGTKVSGDLAVDVSAEDNVGVERVELYANGVFIAEATAAPYRFTVNTLNFADGALSLTAKAWDKAGNEGRSAAVTVTVDNVPDPVDTQAPVVTITSPANGTKVGKKVTISIKATDNVGVTGIQCFIDGALKASTTGSSLSYTWNTTPAAAGTHTIQAVASDAAGNKGSATVQVIK